MLYNKGADLNQCEKNGCSPLYTASLNGHKGCVDLLLNKGADVHSDIVEMLCDKEVDINKCPFFGYSPLYTASLNGHKACVKVLLHKGADVKKCNVFGDSAIAAALENGDNDIVEMLCNSETIIYQRE